MPYFHEAVHDIFARDEQSSTIIGEQTLYSIRALELVARVYISYMFEESESRTGPGKPDKGIHKRWVRASYGGGTDDAVYPIVYSEQRVRVCIMPTSSAHRNWIRSILGAELSALVSCPPWLPRLVIPIRVLLPVRRFNY